MPPKITLPPEPETRTQELTPEAQIAEQGDEIQRLRAENERLSRENNALKPAPPRPISGKVPKELVEQARNIVVGLKRKYAGASETSNPSEVAAEYAFQTWIKVAEGNVNTGRDQLVSGVEPMIEKYYRRKLFGK